MPQQTQHHKVTMEEVNPERRTETKAVVEVAEEEVTRGMSKVESQDNTLSL